MHRGAFTRRLSRRDPGMLERFPGHLEQQSLLGIHGFGFTRGNPEVIGVETGHVGQEPTPLPRHPARRERIRVIKLVGIPAICRDLTDPIARLGQELPIALRA